MAVPPAKGLDEACAWLRKAALTPFPPVTKSEQDYGHGRNKTRTLGWCKRQTLERRELKLVKKRHFDFHQYAVILFLALLTRL